MDTGCFDDTYYSGGGESFFSYSSEDSDYHRYSRVKTRSTLEKIRKKYERVKNEVEKLSTQEKALRKKDSEKAASVWLKITQKKKRMKEIKTEYEKEGGSAYVLDM